MFKDLSRERAMSARIALLARHAVYRRVRPYGPRDLGRMRRPELLSAAPLLRARPALTTLAENARTVLAMRARANTLTNEKAGLIYRCVTKSVTIVNVCDVCARASPRCQIRICTR